MKKTIFVTLAFMLVTLVSPSLKAATFVGIPTTTTTAADSARASEIVARVYAIQAMDKSKLTATEKHGLKKEVRSLRKQLREMNGVYLSVGAIIIIILLLILIL